MSKYRIRPSYVCSDGEVKYIIEVYGLIFWSQAFLGSRDLTKQAAELALKQILECETTKEATT